MKKILLFLAVLAVFANAKYIRKNDIVISKNLMWQDDSASQTNKLNWNDAKKQCETSL